MNKAHIGKRYAITLPELIFLLFGRKVCHSCNAQLVRRRTDEIRTDINSNITAGSNFDGFSPGQKVKVYSHYYTCLQCKKEISLSELSKQKRG